MARRKASYTLLKYRLQGDLWKENPDVHQILKESSSLEEARKALFNYLNELEWMYRSGFYDVHQLEKINAMESIRVFKNVISPENEKLAGTSSLSYLWKLARGEMFDEVSEGFILEFTYLLRGIVGKSGIYPSWLMKSIERPPIEKLRGREASLARSSYLDKMGEIAWGYIQRYHSGLEPEVIERRKENRKRILDYFNATEEDWYDYKWHFRHVFKDKEDLKHLEKLVKLTPVERKAIQLAVENHVPFGITPYYLSLMDYEPNGKWDHQVRAQVIPPIYYVEKMITHREDRAIYFDFMKEHDTSPIDLVTRRYPMISIIKPYDACPQVCVYCQRNWEITGPLAPGAMMPKAVLDRALDWFADHTQMREVLVTGGDPLVMSDKRIEYMLKRFSKMDHIISVRFGTRVPVTVPCRVTDDLAEMMGSYYEDGKRIVCIVTHVEHPYEVTPDLAEACRKFRKNGIYVYNQEVFTLENSRRFETVALRIAMKKVGIDPYYNFNMKGKEETRDYMVPIARILQERKEEARLLPGQFRTDEPVFNVPGLGKNHLRAWQDHAVIMIRPDGGRVYLFHPWEKNIALESPYVYVDEPIKEYLDRLKEKGEDPKDYESIWYYY